jgi:hypothetical protein
MWVSTRPAGDRPGRVNYGIVEWLCGRRGKTVLRKSVLALWVLLFIGGLGAPTLASAQASFTCADFNTQEAAQAILDADIDEDTTRALDPDGDGLACEDLPSSGNGNQGEPTSAPDETAVPEEPEETVVPDEPGAKKPLDARFGGSRDSFEAEYGDPVDAEQGIYPLGNYYEVDGFDSVNAFYHKEYVAYITLTSDAAAPWSKIKANQLVKGFLPSDVELDKAVNTDDGDAITTGHSKALEKRFGESTYEKYGAQGELGDLYFILRLNEDSKVESIEVALGHELQTGEEPTPVETPAASGNITPEQLEYLTTIREEVDTLTVSLDMFNQVLDAFSAGTVTAEEAVNQLVAIFTTWQTADTTAQGITPPAGLEETHALYLEFTGLLAGAAEDYATGITNSDDAAYAAGDEKLAQAQALLPIIDALFTLPEE